MSKIKDTQKLFLVIYETTQHPQQNYSLQYIFKTNADRDMFMAVREKLLKQDIANGTKVWEEKITTNEMTALNFRTEFQCEPIYTQMEEIPESKCFAYYT